MFERDKMHFTSEKERFNEYSLKVKRRADEIEHLAISSREEKERAHQEQFLANKIKDEHQSKLQQIAQQMQTLRDKEHQILQEKEELVKEKYELESKRNSMLCVKCKVSAQLPLNVQPPQINTTSLMSYPVVNGITNNIPQTFIDPSLILWQLSAQKDHAYLEEELAYLQSLKERDKKIGKS
nr:fas-binding factor 1-like [Parasteatoda tepidariorum]